MATSDTSMNIPSIFVEQFVHEGLGNSAYLVGSHDTKIAVLIDPLRDVDQYLAAAERMSVEVRYVLDTHLHADFVSGAREAAARTKAIIGASANAGLEFNHRPLSDNDHIWLGDATLQVRATPGHSPEHIAFILNKTTTREPAAVFTGGALTVGGAARTDLLGHDLSLPLARQLFYTFHDKLMCLPDEVLVYPTHGAGSFCVAPVSAERASTIGRERMSNPLAYASTEAEFVRRAMSGLPSYPAYYLHMRPLNRRGPPVLGGLPKLKPCPPTEVQQMIEQGAAVLDVRRHQAFAAGHIPGAFAIPVSAPLLVWAGWLIPFGSPLVLVAQSQREREEAVRQLICIGFDDVRGYLDGGMEAWRAAGLPEERIESITAPALRQRLAADSEQPLVLDVRHDSEWLAGHIPGAIHIENGRLPYDELPLPADRLIAVHCGHDSRSMAGISVLKRRGYRNLIQIEGGFTDWEAAGFEVERG